MNPQDKISKHFTWKEALWLPNEGRMATEYDGLTEEIKDNLVVLFNRMDQVREYFNAPVIVHICFRSMTYHIELYARINKDRVAKGLPELRVPMGSAHLYGRGVDFHVKGISCADAKKKIMEDNMLEAWGMRMEKIDGEWIHLDTKAPGPSGRYFTP